jgi:hypothetical protein
VGKKSKKEEKENSLDGETKPKRRARSTSSRKKTPAKTAKPAALIAEPTDEEIRMRAYFIAERRHRFDLPGNADSDWLEAKRQLLSELGPR